MTEPTFAVEYGYVPDMTDRRAPHREDHLSFLRSAAAEGWMVLAGALTDPVDGGWLVVRAADDAAARRRVQDDPYVRAGLVRAITVRSLAMVVPG